MERLLILRLSSEGVAAEARLNDIPVARTPAGGGVVSVPVHEFTFAGDNRLALVIGPGQAPQTPVLREAPSLANVRLLLPRTGQPGSETSARTLAALDWAAPADELFRVPLRVQDTPHLKVKFPRWRFQDAPALGPPEAQAEMVAGFLQDLALSLMRGDPEVFAAAARLRFEEVALAYQRRAEDDLARWRARVQLLHAQKALKLPLPLPADLNLRACADGRLLECLGADGQPVLRCTRPDGSQLSWPLRVAIVEGRVYVLR